MINIICLKHGTKYKDEYVNKLFNMISRHLTLPHRFICFTENPQGLNPSIETRPLPEDENLQGWWWKLYVFKQGHFSSGDINFFIDLDMVIIRNIDKLFEYLPGEFIGLQNLNRVFNRYPQSLGSAVLRWPAETYCDIWDEFKKNIKNAKTLHGDQDWIWKLYQSKIKFFPRDWIISYKWEAREHRELVRVNGRLNFINKRNPSIPSDTSILAFHGSPDPHEVTDDVILDNWR